MTKEHVTELLLLAAFPARFLVPRDFEQSDFAGKARTECVENLM